MGPGVSGWDNSALTAVSANRDLHCTTHRFCPNMHPRPRFGCECRIIKSRPRGAPLQHITPSYASSQRNTVPLCIVRVVTGTEAKYEARGNLQKSEERRNQRRLYCVATIILQCHDTGLCSTCMHRFRLSPEPNSGGSGSPSTTDVAINFKSEQSPSRPDPDTSLSVPLTQKANTKPQERRRKYENDCQPTLQSTK